MASNLRGFLMRMEQPLQSSLAGGLDNYYKTRIHWVLAIVLFVKIS